MQLAWRTGEAKGQHAPRADDGADSLDAVPSATDALAEVNEPAIIARARAELGAQF